MIKSEIVLNLFPGIASFAFQDLNIAVARIVLIVMGFLLAYYGYKRKLEPLIMVPMGVGLICINAGVLFLKDGSLGTLFVAPLVEDPSALINIMQVNFLQPIYNFMFSNSLIACLVFMGIGAMSEISFIIMNPFTSIFIALCAELGTFVALVIGVYLGLTPQEAASVAIIGGADGPMVLFGSLMMAPKLFVPISIIAYLYLSLTYAAYPYLVKKLVPTKYRGIDYIEEIPEIQPKTIFIFCLAACALLCLLLPVAAPLIMSFFLGLIIKEAKIEPYLELLENTILYLSTLLLGLMLGTLCEASVLLDPKVIKLLIIGVAALLFSGLGGIAGGWIMYVVKKKNFNPLIGIAGVSCVPTTAKIAQHVAEEENPFAVILPIAMGANIAGVIVSAIATGIYVSTIGLVQ
ncbi:Na+-transporting malonate decarboxylase, carboxybiotin decarboxylase subunit [Cloacibacillus sp. An23]|uniref:Na+-transporting malonate decarboxylase, carboxybiotin decarboxylase subunit n=1 Tax=Cloacibacillus sp. An23 TaxID=1965591 RepID=UPI000B3A92B8|nr:Na+-transporting malonate decarboxylase, carboxybiotin decarboxylase subunit [Cloacibacillus sp. An23]OUO92968.1 Na+-transporting malonate decarboxylase, carboxybiotin decarboxylase subunit [Cloacibacillus sp. An23]